MDRSPPDDIRAANKLMEVLEFAITVYRTLNFPLGNVTQISPGTCYCIEGLFMPTIASAYEFVPYDPTVQYKAFSADGKDVESLTPPRLLIRKEFSRTYANALEILYAKDLSICVPSHAPCINVRYQSSPEWTLANLISDPRVMEPYGRICVAAIIANAENQNEESESVEKFQ